MHGIGRNSPKRMIDTKARVVRDGPRKYRLITQGGEKSFACKSEAYAALGEYNNTVMLFDRFLYTRPTTR